MSVLVFLLVTVLEFGIAIAGKWLIAGRLKPGRYPLWGLTYFRWWLSDRLIEAAPSYFISGSSLHAWWLRALGAKVGQDAYIGSITLRAHDLVSVGDGVSIGNAVNIENARVFHGELCLGSVQIADQAHVGSYAVIEANTSIGPWGHLDAQSALREGQQVPPRRMCTGSPLRDMGAFDPNSLPPRPPVGRWQLFGEGLFFVLGALLIATLFFLPVFPSFMLIDKLDDPEIWSWLIVAPHAMVISAGYGIVLAAMPAASTERWWDVATQLALDGILFGGVCFVFVALFKWILIGRYRKRATPMWTPFVWLSEATTNMYEGLVVPNFMRYLRGTPWLPLAFKLLGCRIGRGVYMDTTDLTEFDCVSMGDHTEINALVCPQTHLFEDRVMKIDHVHIGEKVNIGPRSIVLYGAQVGDGAQLGPMTLVMKGENIPKASCWSGNPAEPIR